MIDWKNAEFVTAPRSETPETDEEVRGPLGPHDYVHASFARSLECRLHEAEAEVSRLRSQVEWPENASAVMIEAAQDNLAMQLSDNDIADMYDAMRAAHVKGEGKG